MTAIDHNKLVKAVQIQIIEDIDFCDYTSIHELIEKVLELPNGEEILKGFIPEEDLSKITKKVEQFSVTTQSPLRSSSYTEEMTFDQAVNEFNKMAETLALTNGYEVKSLLSTDSNCVIVGDNDGNSLFEVYLLD